MLGGVPTPSQSWRICSRGSLKKKCEPFFPNTLGTNALKQIIVALTMSLEVKAQIEEWLTQSAFGAEKQCN